MTRDEAKDYIKSQLKAYLESNGIDTSKKFKCRMGTHEDKNPSMSYKDNRVKCFSCGASADIFDLIGLEYGLSDNSAIFAKAYEIFGIEIAQEPHSGRNKPVKPLGGISITPNKEKALNRPVGPQNDIDYTEYYKKTRETLKNDETALLYLINRGLSIETIYQSGLGYDPAWKHPGSETMHPTQRIIIPATTGSYTARDINPAADKKYKALKVGASSLFNTDVLNQTRPVFIAEGEIDALSVIECGASAMALGSTNNVNKLIDLIKAGEVKAEYLVISLDNDGAGEKAAKELIDYLKTTGILFLKANISGKHKDINEALQTDRPALEKNIEALTKWYAAACEHTQMQDISGETAAAHLPALMDRINTNKKIRPISTGFTALDFILDGGLYGDSLYFIGSISSLGKTTLALQIADNVAQQGETALIFSLEMARAELMAKSISRLSFLNSGEDRITSATTREVMTGNYETIKTKTDLIYLTDSEQTSKRENITQSITEYGRYAEKIVIHEGVGVTTIQTIKNTVGRFIKAGIKPVVFIDYMQIIAPSNDRKTDKQTLDETVMLLKQMAREYQISIIGVSSFNRESYTSPVSMASFKESGAVEYSSDVLIGLQLEGIEAYSKLSDAQKKSSGFDVDRLKSEYPRKIELKILKNRNGITGEILNYKLYSKYNYFKEVKPYNAFNEPEQPPKAIKGKGKVETQDEQQAAAMMEVRQKR